MNHSARSVIEYTTFGVGIILGIFIFTTPFLVNTGWVSERFLIAKSFTSVVGVLILVVTFAWGYWAHQKCKKGVCDLTPGPRQEK